MTNSAVVCQPVSKDQYSISYRVSNFYTLRSSATKECGAGERDGSGLEGKLPSRGRLEEGGAWRTLIAGICPNPAARVEESAAKKPRKTRDEVRGVGVDQHWKRSDSNIIENVPGIAERRRGVAWRSVTWRAACWRGTQLLLAVHGLCRWRVCRFSVASKTFRRGHTLTGVYQLIK